MSSGGHHHDPRAASQNLGNSLGNRSCVRQTKFFRMYESGNTMKNLLGHGQLQWDTTQKEGAYAGQPVADPYEQWTSATSGAPPTNRGAAAPTFSSSGPTEDNERNGPQGSRAAAYDPGRYASREEAPTYQPAPQYPSREHAEVFGSVPSRGATGSTTETRTTPELLLGQGNTYAPSGQHQQHAAATGASATGTGSDVGNPYQKSSSGSTSTSPPNYYRTSSAAYGSWH